MATLESLDNQVRIMNTKIANVEKAITEIKADLKIRITQATLTTATDAVNLRVDALSVAVDEVEDKAQNILNPNQTIAYLGKDQLNTFKTRIVQMQAIVQEVEAMQKSVLDMVTAFKAGQEGVVL